MHNRHAVWSCTHTHTFDRSSVSFAHSSMQPCSAGGKVGVSMMLASYIADIRLGVYILTGQLNQVTMNTVADPTIARCMWSNKTWDL